MTTDTIVNDSESEGLQAQDVSHPAQSQNDRVRNDITVVCLSHGHVAAAATADREAFKTNAAHKYIHNTPDARPPSRRAELLRHVVLRLNYHYDVHRKRRLFTVKESGGYSIVEVYAPGEYKMNPSSPLEKLLRKISAKVENQLSTPQQKERQAERTKKTTELTFRTLGPDILNEAWLLITLVTHPDYQRRGYGGALVDAVTNLTDSSGKPCILMSTDEANNAFYEAHGFVVAGQTLLGDTNSTWKEAPVVCSVMTRDPAREKK